MTHSIPKNHITGAHKPLLESTASVDLSEAETVVPSDSGLSDPTPLNHQGAVSLGQLRDKTPDETSFETVPLLAIGEGACKDATYENTKPTRPDAPRREAPAPPLPPRSSSVTQEDALHWLKLLEKQYKARKVNEAVVKMARKALGHEHWEQVACISRTALILVLGNEPHDQMMTK